MTAQDELTGLANRQTFQERLEESFRLAQCREVSVAVLLLDLDRFKRINLNFGRDAGDLVLREVASRIKSTVRGSDTIARLTSPKLASKSSRMARMGGDSAPPRGVRLQQAGAFRPSGVTASLPRGAGC